MCPGTQRKTIGTILHDADRIKARWRRHQDAVITQKIRETQANLEATAAIGLEVASAVDRVRQSIAAGSITQALNWMTQVGSKTRIPSQDYFDGHQLLEPITAYKQLYRSYYFPDGGEDGAEREEDVLVVRAREVMETLERSKGRIEVEG